MKPIIAIAVLMLATVASVFADAPAIIPLPQKMELQPGTFQLTTATRIHANSAARATASYLAAHLRPSTGFPLKTSGTWFSRGSGPDNILLTTKAADTNLGPEGYELTVTPTNNPSGLMRRVTTCPHGSVRARTSSRYPRSSNSRLAISMSSTSNSSQA